ncbi:hypothetical protein WQ57_13925 [Mesobacillus campisalis]|uniref:Uncharacterized protein n=1 Tax=Mesobacillus campisalis TaxID=1408103 RepID=A0A0M2SV03_9BACI|nr:hypothetical protein [Mesobacillus campisalis]KKK37531.1 hypothetical protein WQ57_13925 [Mesobacillus campisalis]
MSKFEDNYTQHSVYIENSLGDKLQQAREGKGDKQKMVNDALTMYFNREKQIEDLFTLLDELVDNQLALNDVIKVLGGDENQGMLDEAITQVEMMIVKAFGGHEGHYRHISGTDLFYNYEWYEGEEHKTELVDYIKRTVENDWTNEIGITIVRD